MGRGTVIAAGALLAAGAAAAFLLLQRDGGAPPPAASPKDAPRSPTGAGTVAKAGPRADAPPPATPRTGDGVVTGVLLRSRTGLPLEGTVTATGRAGGVSTVPSRADGSFRLARLPRGEPLRLECTAPGLLPRVLPRIVVPAGQDLDLSYIFLGEGVGLEVIAVDGTGTPVGGCTVSIRGPQVAGEAEMWAQGSHPEAEAMTDEGGRVTFATLPPGPSEVVAVAPGRARVVVAVELAEGAKRDPLRILLGPGNSLEGRVLESDSRPAAGALVSAFIDLPRKPENGTVSASADEAGRFRLGGLALGTLVVEVRVLPGTLERFQGYAVPAPGAIEIRLAARAELRGRVVEESGGGPVEGAEVGVNLEGAMNPENWETADAHTLTGPDGEFRFPALPVLAIRGLEAQKAGYLPFQEQPSAHAGSGLPAVGSGKDLEMRLKRGTVVRGVAREAGGKPVPGAWVQLTVWRPKEGTTSTPEVHTDGEGRFVFPAVLPGRALLEAGARNRHLGGVPKDTWDALQNGELPESCGVVVPEQGEVVKDLLLVPDARVEGRILYRDGTPAPGFATGVTEPSSLGSGFPGTVSAADGSFVVEDLAAGSAMVVAAFGPWGRAGESTPFEIEESAVVKGVTVTVASPASLSGRVVREDRKPAEGATLRLIPFPRDLNRPVDAGEAEAGAKAIPVAADGTFGVEALAPGWWVPEGSAPGCLRHRGDPVELGDGEKRTGVEVVLPPERFLSGRVLLFDGTPAAGARVRATKTANPMGGELAGNQGGNQEVLADGEGRFRLGGLEEGSYEVHAAREDSVSTDGTADSGSSDLVLRLGQGFAIEGRVVEAGTGKPLEGIDVAVRSSRPDADGKQPEESGMDPGSGGGSAGGRSNADQHSCRTTAEGTFRIPGLAAGTYDLSIGDPDGSFVPKAVPGVRAGGKAILVEIARGLAITGRVQDSGGVPLAPGQLGLAVVSAALPGWTSYLDVAEDGSFSVMGLAPGTYWLTVHSENYGGRPDIYVPRTVEAEAGRGDLVIPLVRGKTITGRVRMADGTEPGEGGVQLHLHPARGAALPDSIDPCPMEPDGSFTTVPLPDGVPFDLEASRSEDGTAAAARDLLPGTTGVVIQMQAGGSIRGRVVDPEGKPVAGAVAWAVSSRTDREFARAGATAEGGFVLEGLPLGTYRLYASSQDSNMAPAEPEGAVATGTADAVVRTVKGIEFRARCVGEDGKPVGTASALVERWTKGRWEGTSVYPLKEGLLVIRGLLPGRIRFQVLRPGESQGLPDPQRFAGPFDIPCPEQVITVR